MMIAAIIHSWVWLMGRLESKKKEQEFVFMCWWPLGHVENMDTCSSCHWECLSGENYNQTNSGRRAPGKALVSEMKYTWLYLPWLTGEQLGQRADAARRCPSRGSGVLMSPGRRERRDQPLVQSAATRAWGDPERQELEAQTGRGAPEGRGAAVSAGSWRRGGGVSPSFWHSHSPTGCLSGDASSRGLH